MGSLHVSAALFGLRCLRSFTFNSWLVDSESSTSTSTIPKDFTAVGPRTASSSRTSRQRLHLQREGMWIDTNKNNGVQETDCTNLPYNLDGGEANRRRRGTPTPLETSPALFSTGTPSNASWRIWVDRHNSKTSNVTFADGHAANVSLTKLWTDCTWYNGWTPQQPLSSSLPSSDKPR